MIEADIRSHLINYANLTALVSNNIFAIRLPNTPAYPNIVFTRVGTDNTSVVNGASSIRRYRFQFDLYSSGYSELINIADQLERAMLAATSFTSVLVNGPIHLGFEESIGAYRAVMTFSVWQSYS